jgi:hypothetical protein
MSQRHIRAFEKDFDITVIRADGKLQVTVSEGEKIMVNKIIKEGKK